MRAHRILYAILAILVQVEAQGQWTDWTQPNTNVNSGTVSIPLTGFPQGTWSSNTTRQASIPAGGQAFLNAGTPPGAMYGTSRNKGYLSIPTNGRTVETVIMFDGTFPPHTSVVLGDVDAESVQLVPLDKNGNILPCNIPGSDVDLFNYCTSGSPIPGGCNQSAIDVPDRWDSTTCTCVGKGPDVTGSSCSIEITDPLVAGFKFISYTLTGFPTYQTWFASLERRISGSVTACGAGYGKYGQTVNLLDVNGNILSTTTTDANGLYSFSSLAATSFKVQLVPTSPFSLEPSSQTNPQIVDLSNGNATVPVWTLSCPTTTTTSSSTSMTTSTSSSSTSMTTSTQSTSSSTSSSSSSKSTSTSSKSTTTSSKSTTTKSTTTKSTSSTKSSTTTTETPVTITTTSTRTLTSTSFAPIPTSTAPTVTSTISIGPSSTNIVPSRITTTETTCTVSQTLDIFVSTTLTTTWTIVSVSTEFSSTTSTSTIYDTDTVRVTSTSTHFITSKITSTVGLVSTVTVTKTGVGKNVREEGIVPVYKFHPRATTITSSVTTTTTSTITSTPLAVTVTPTTYATVNDPIPTSTQILTDTVGICATQAVTETQTLSFTATQTRVTFSVSVKVQTETLIDEEQVWITDTSTSIIPTSTTITQSFVITTTAVTTVTTFVTPTPTNDFMQYAQTCRPGASYNNPKNCCCASRRGITFTRYKIQSTGLVTVTLTKTVTKKGKRQDISGQHLCGACPKNPLTLTKTVYCCPTSTEYKTVTKATGKARYTTKTRRVTVTKQ